MNQTNPRKVREEKLTTTAREVARIFADIDVEQRGKLMRLIGEHLHSECQYHTGTLFIEAGAAYGEPK